MVTLRRYQRFLLSGYARAFILRCRGDSYVILKFTIKRVKDIQLTKTYEKVKFVSTVLLLKLTVALEAYSSAYHRYRAYGKHVRILYI